MKDYPAAPRTKGDKGNPGGSARMVLPLNVGFGYTAIPDKYESLATTDQTVTVEQGNQIWDIKLTK